MAPLQLRVFLRVEWMWSSSVEEARFLYHRGVRKIGRFFTPVHSGSAVGAQVFDFFYFPAFHFHRLSPQTLHPPPHTRTHTTPLSRPNCHPRQKVHHGFAFHRGDETRRNGDGLDQERQLTGRSEVAPRPQLEGTAEDLSDTITYAEHQKCT